MSWSVVSSSGLGEELVVGLNDCSSLGGGMMPNDCSSMNNGADPVFFRELKTSRTRSFLSRFLRFTALPPLGNSTSVDMKELEILASAALEVAGRVSRTSLSKVSKMPGGNVNLVMEESDVEIMDALVVSKVPNCL